MNKTKRTKAKTESNSFKNFGFKGQKRNFPPISKFKIWNREQLGRNFLQKFRKSGQGSRLEWVGEGRRLLSHGFRRIAATTLTFLTAEEEGERGGEIKGKKGWGQLATAVSV
ncbi:hypothetical protein H5410_027025 [Solanum commersonii]|uniref:Uncharacterized protein n=1 Tax=Solanum commersonii TaxID=4109 RepID=A0A9J5Z053_SOLCO|nr:hypothetical protein H5410_027025 [Solanum commersonii]